MRATSPDGSRLFTISGQSSGVDPPLRLREIERPDSRRMVTTNAQVGDPEPLISINFTNLP